MTGATTLETRTLDRCLACGSTRLDPLAMRYEFHGSFPAAECTDCGMRFLRVQPTVDSLARLYSAEYFESEFRSGRTEVSSFAEDAFHDENRSLLDAFEALRPPGRLLEIGSAGGALLKQARDRGWNVTGVELSAAAVAHARGLGLEIHHGNLPGVALPAAAFDLVYIGDVLEHVPDCRATAAEIARVLAPGGFLYLRGPITTHSLARSFALGTFGAMGRTITLREPPYHLWEFRPRPLARLLQSVGLQVIRLTQSKIPPGHAHGKKSSLQRLVMGAIDAVNVPITRLFNARGDRVLIVAVKRG
jgi:2-polyprenyl-3-methyl-5-hydroxy-6-metoxy-1,4-benzoquinol methylase